MVYGRGMKATGRSQGWFEQLRRDSAPFALLAALLLLANAFHPLARAGDAGRDLASIVCTSHAAAAVAVPDAGGDDPGRTHDCPVCIAGNHCGGTATPRLPASVGPAFALPGSTTGPLPARFAAVAPGEGPGDPPPAIRAPPSFA